MTPGATPATPATTAARLGAELLELLAANVLRANPAEVALVDLAGDVLQRIVGALGGVDQVRAILDAEYAVADAAADAAIDVKFPAR